MYRVALNDAALIFVRERMQGRQALQWVQCRLNEGLILQPKLQRTEAKAAGLPDAVVGCLEFSCRKGQSLMRRSAVERRERC